MRSILTFGIALTLGLFSTQAFANGHLDITLADGGDGCVVIQNVVAPEGFPTIDGKVVGEITLHFSNVDAGSVVMQSPRYYVAVTENEDGSVELSPRRLCTLTGTGVKYFKYALWTKDYDLIEWMPAEDFDNAKHRVDIH